MTDQVSPIDRTDEWAKLKSLYLKPPAVRAASSGRGLHHFALVCRDVEETIEFFDGLLEFPLVELFENRDYEGSTHIFFDVGHDNYLAYFDFPGLDIGAYQEVLGGLHHIAISVTRQKFDRLLAKLRGRGIEPHLVGDESAYFSGPNGERLELLTYSLNDMYGTVVSD